jgi:diaminohydroxyphosphoribosylaminopyrimidine deaminase/5-amino-6-(5-phosphoribosylamino)uracil reductase
VAIVEAGVARVVAAAEDPNPLVCGRGFDYLRAHGTRVDVGTRADAAVALNQPFFTLMRAQRPFVILKAATSLDGRIAAAAGQRTRLTSAEANRHALDGRIAAAAGQRTRLTSAAANRHAHRVRAEVDAIGVGVGTVLVDDPQLTARGAYRERPLTRVIFDRQLRTPPTAQVLSTREAGPVIIVTTAEGAAHGESRRRLEAGGAEVEVARDGSLARALERLGEIGIGSLLLEGGAAVHRAAWEEGVVDYVRLYVAPRVLGPGGVPFLEGSDFSSATLIERRVEPLGQDVVIEGYVHGPR